MEKRRAKPLRAAWMLALAMLAAGCAGMPGMERLALDVSLVNLVPRELSPLEQVMDVTLRVRNPNNQPLVLTGAKFNLEVNGRPLLLGLSNERLQVPRLGSTLMKAEGSTTTVGLIRQVFDFNPDRPIRYKLKGVAFAEGVLSESIPFESAGELDLRPPEERKRR